MRESANVPEIGDDRNALSDKFSAGIEDQISLYKFSGTLRQASERELRETEQEYFTSTLAFFEDPHKADHIVQNTAVHLDEIQMQFSDPLQ